jgi:hypothetical protein
LDGRRRMLTFQQEVRGAERKVGEETNQKKKKPGQLQEAT